MVVAALASSLWLAGTSARASTEPAASDASPADIEATASTAPEASPAATAEPIPPPQPPPLAFGRGAYLELAGGSSGGLIGGMTMGIAATVGGGYLFEGRRFRRFRAALGVHAINHVRPGSDGLGIFFGSARLGLGVATRRLLAMGHVGVGPAMLYGGAYSGGVRSELQTVVSVAGSLRGRVSERVGLGVEVGALRGFPFVDTHLYALFSATWIWDARRKESGR